MILRDKLPLVWEEGVILNDKILNVPVGLKGVIQSSGLHVQTGGGIRGWGDSGGQMSVFAAHGRACTITRGNVPSPRGLPALPGWILVSF